MTQIGAFPAGLAQTLANNVTDVNTALNQIKTVVNTNIDADNLSASNGIVNTYKQILPSLLLCNYTSGVVTQVTNGNTYLARESDPTVTTPLQAASAGSAVAAFYIDPADYTAGSKLNKYRLRVSFIVNTTAPASTFTFGLYPVTATGGANGPTLTLGAVTAGSTVAFAAPGASSLNQGNSGDFTAPAAGYYAVACPITVATSTLGSAFNARVILQHRQV